MKKSFYTFLMLGLLAVFAVPALAQTPERDKTLNITVTDDTGESLLGQTVALEQTDYSLNYTPAELDADGKATMTVYAGNHTLTVERSGYNTVSETFNISADETVKNISVKLTEKTRTPFSLAANLVVDPYTAANKLVLTWNTEKPAFSDDFESYDAFAVEFGDWTGIDGDKLNAAALTGDYPNRGVRQYAQIMNPLAVTPMWYYDYPVLRAYSGKQYVGFVRTSSGGANNDWLISPEITVGTDNYLSFLAKAADVYDEKFIVYVTTKTDNPGQGDFVKLSSGNYETVNYKGWHEMRYDLSAYAGQKVKVAIRYIGEYNNGGSFMLMVDDFYVGPLLNNSRSAAAPRSAFAPKGVRAVGGMMKSAANPNETFEIFLDGEKVGETPNYTYTINNLSSEIHSVGVRAKYIAASSEIVKTYVTVDMNSYFKLSFDVSADSKASVDGTKINILSESTGEDYTLTVDGGKAEIMALHGGKYDINISKGAFKEYNSSVDLTADKHVAVELEDDVTTPYNITAALSDGGDGTTTALLKWNQVLGFSDSFEDYDDFATGEFGGWKSVDLDKMPVYPIALGSQDNIVSFPGSGTATNPTAIAPMVFNPWNTTPAMLPADPAMQAPYGDKYVIFFSAQRSKSDKWLISPLVDIYEGYQLKATAKAYTTYPESIEFAVSESGSDNPDDFTVISRAENMPYSEWTVYSTPLDAYAGKSVRVAIHYYSTDAFFAQVDNVRVEPEDGSGTVVDYGNVVKFNVYLDGKFAGESTTPEFTLKGLSEGNHTVGVEAVYKNRTSDMATYEIVVTAIGEVRMQAIPANARIFTLQGQKTGCSVDALPGGVYIVKSGNTVMKIRK